MADPVAEWLNKGNRSGLPLLNPTPEQRKQFLDAPATHRFVDQLVTHQIRQVRSLDDYIAQRLDRIENSIGWGNVGVGLGVLVGVVGVGLTVYQLVRSAEPRGPTEPVR